ncbi:hypothetical protein SAMN05216169_10318 [Anoxybacillus pushchinoensis]|uniref:Uncharacterized protein n=1 Tax=Anoxybacillus pushchinoensis TaxID=150248 RepID=A0A1I0TK58_9BACL|nr:hypothetical protein [Anoxybacillus pushchinoensis]SFA52067.1 hypothetical protein SAMN05216169_10318 [Anoxybacillus pushchinoensis]
MMKRQRWLIVYIVCIFLAISSPYWLWNIKPTTTLNVLIVNKTVPDQTYREHGGLVWLLNQQKYVKPNGTRYDVKKDYVGFMPTTKKERPWPTGLQSYDVIYVADTYGVYENDLTTKKKKGKRSKKVYGGLTEQEVNRLHEAMFAGNKTLIAEFNSFASPTDPSVRNKFYSLLNVEWTGWIGRYFPKLEDDEVPVWVKENYEKQYDKRYAFTGPGYVLVDEYDRLVILNKNEIGKQGVLFTPTKKGEKELGVSGSTPYSYWFDIVKPLHDEEVLATYTLSLSKSGKEKLQAIGLPTTFPAIVHHRNNRYDAYYFCGDYADQPDVPNIYQTVGIDIWRKWTTPHGPNSTASFYWKAYVPMMKTILKQASNDDKQWSERAIAKTDDGIQLAGRVGEQYIQIYKNGKWENMLLKGVNMGIAKPGHFPGETAITKEEYFRWFKQIGAMHANAVRVYTIHPPAFYEAFYEYNEMAERPLYLFHGVWVNEETFLRTNDAFAKENTDEFVAEIKRTIDIVHGRATIPPRPGHASGIYRYDISPYVLGWIFGVEWEPTVVHATNMKHAGLRDYEGEYVYTKGASPFEIWLARMMDEAIAYETKTYGWQRPVSFTNWVTTDLLTHPSEPLEKEDFVSVNPNVIYTTNAMHSGLFASYHIYPYYPDFLNYEPKYVNYIDHRGEKNNYAGYLHDMKRVHRMPIVVAEFGVPSSRGMTHRNVYGMNQGFHSEQQQGLINKKLFEDIVHEQMGGGFIFTWQDEWFKRTWNTMDYDNPDRRPFWSNAQTNEQQFGLLSFDPTENETTMIKADGRKEDWEFLRIRPAFKQHGRALYMTSDERYVYIRYDTTVKRDKDVYILFDTIPNQGQSTILDVPNVRTEGIDFVLHLRGEKEGRLWIDSYYDSFYYHYGHMLQMIDRLPYVNKKNNGMYHPIRLTLNKKLQINGKTYPFDFYETGVMTFGTANPNDEAYNSLTDVSVSKQKDGYEIRIPWALLNVKDPSMHEVMGDMWQGGLTSSKTIDGIRIGVYENEFSYPTKEGHTLHAKQFYTYTWDAWEEPTYHERLKRSYTIVKETYKRIEVGER